jgi:CelD/BcsL family acetyltransferase involved in cellulose biosynthesis
MWNIEPLHDIEAFLSTVAAAREAAPDRHSNLRYFSHPEWTRIVWAEREAERGSRFIGLVARDLAGDVTGWWPLVLSKRSFGWRLQNLGQEICDYAEPHVAIGADAPSLVSTMMRAVEKLASRFTFAQFANFQPAGNLALTDPPVAEELADLGGGWRVGPTRDDLRLDAGRYGNDWQTFLAERISTRQRKNMRHEWNVLCRRGTISIERPDRAALAALKPAYLDWYRYGQDDAARRQKLDIWWSVFLAMEEEAIAPSVLRIDGEPASIVIAFPRQRDLDLFSLVFDPRFAADSVGKLHLQRVIRAWMETGGGKFHFLVGSEDYKAHLSNEVVKVRSLYFYHRRNIQAFFRAMKPRGEPLGKRLEAKPSS